MPIPKQYYEAGRIATIVRDEARKRSHVGKSLFEICEFVENRIRSAGGHPAFPCNICLNNVAAHYTPLSAGDLEVKEGDLLKIDIGVHVDGYIADTAVSVCDSSEHESLIRATESALAEALGMMRKNIKAGVIGERVYKTATTRGFKPISNLSGHSLERYVIHAGKSIPNVWVQGTSTLEEDEVYAVEPFLTTSDGSGIVVDGGQGNIYSLLTRKKTGNRELDLLLNEIWNSFRTLPFSPRWLTRLGEVKSVDQLLKELVKKKVLRTYPMLVEGRGRVVAQAEHTVAISESGIQVLTR